MERSSFFNAVLNGETYDRVYLAEDYARYFSSFIGNGVYPTPSTNLQVVANGTTMNIILKAGKGWINGYFYENTDDLTLNVAIADGVLNRIDRVVLRLDFINREIKTYIKKGAFATSPVAPTLVRNSDMYELGLADIKINKGVTKIVQADITDLRQNNTYCGLVAGVVQQIDTTNLFAQFQSTFDIWFQNVKGQLSTDSAGNLQNQLDTIKPLVDTWVDFNTNGLLLDKVANAVRPKSTDSLTLGTNTYKFKDIFVGTHSTSGYTKLPNGYILQWGGTAVSANQPFVDFTLPIAFPNSCFVVMCNGKGVSNDVTKIIWTTEWVEKTQVRLIPRLATTNGVPTTANWCYYIALGY